LNKLFKIASAVVAAQQKNAKFQLKKVNLIKIERSTLSSDYYIIAYIWHTTHKKISYFIKKN